MRFWFSGPRILGIRPGISFSPQELRSARKPASALVHPNHAADPTSFVYVIRGGNYVKVGVTTNPSARIASLQTGSAIQLDFSFIGTTPGQGYDIERAAHDILAPYVCSGEWFDVSPELAASAVLAAAARLGRPVHAISSDAADHILRVGRSPIVSAPIDRAAATRGLFFLLALTVMFAVLIYTEIVKLGGDIPTVLIANGLGALIMWKIVRWVGRRAGSK